MTAKKELLEIIHDHCRACPTRHVCAVSDTGGVVCSLFGTERTRIRPTTGRKVLTTT